MGSTDTSSRCHHGNFRHASIAVVATFDINGDSVITTSSLSTTIWTSRAHCRLTDATVPVVCVTAFETMNDENPMSGEILYNPSVILDFRLSFMPITITGGFQKLANPLATITVTANDTVTATATSTATTTVESLEQIATESAGDVFASLFTTASTTKAKTGSKTLTSIASNTGKNPAGPTSHSNNAAGTEQNRGRRAMCLFGLVALALIR
ncbi:hypothetical protein ANO11243_050850 [Dothideomycetidae sp. 11243]|nr:hypothetical protein ANO11243_050850 [fungal sp. No.11243]